VGLQGRQGAHAWLGIPYAQAPVGDLRWKAPRPPIPWEGRREVLNYGAQCVQLPVIPDSDQGKGYVGSEDCLFLNVWAPTWGPTRIPRGDERRPVMFWIHGGGNTMGSGGSELTDIYDGSTLATEHDVIVVTINYRMGALGWFAPGALQATAGSPEDASGNFGTLDIIAALKWVNRNISYFGGDPDNVTIFGESAGGANVFSLLASPLAKGLFHRAIVQSGMLQIVPMATATAVTTSPWGDDLLTSRELVVRWLLAAGQATSRAAALSRLDDMSDLEVMTFLRGLSPAEIYGIFEESMFGMVSMPMLFGDGHVLPASADAVFASPISYNAVPLMIGTNRDETRLFMAFDPAYMNYLGSLPSGLKDQAAYERDAGYGSDLWKALGVDEVAEAVSRYQSDVFVYRFDADDWRNLGVFDLKVVLGAAHALEIPFVFGNFPEIFKIIFPDSTRDAVDLLTNSMMSYWAAFAYSGEPGQGRNDEQPAWVSWHDGVSSGHFMRLDTDLDGGVGMAQGIMTRDGIRQRFMADDSFNSIEEKCRTYRNVFREEIADLDDYASMGCQ
ncbi:MAG: carboxylesterase family protein, partial [Proteobacteria bacterium]|nr:carboxylesterase family protein [Pseudomonadota bacterium]